MEWNAFQRAKLATFAIFQLLHGSVSNKKRDSFNRKHFSEKKMLHCYTLEIEHGIPQNDGFGKRYLRLQIWPF